MKRIFLFAGLGLALASCAAPKTAPLPAAPPPGEPSGYSGLTAGQLKVAMGEPAFTHKDGAGIEMWRYDGAGCKAFFFLYPDSGNLAVHHVETLPRPSDSAADAGCLNRLRVGGAKVTS